MISSFVLSQVSLSKRVKETFQESMRDLKTGFESRIEKLESEVSAVASKCENLDAGQYPWLRPFKQLSRTIAIQISVS